jgi:peptidoglycan-associated lipoprotein
MKPSLSTLVSAFVVTAVAATIGACGPKAAPAPAPTPARDTAAENSARRDALARENARMAAEAAAARQRVVDDSVAKVRAAEEAMRREAEQQRAIITASIAFEFNKSELLDEAKSALDAKIAILNANANLTIRVAGHADERGSTEYNVALGADRAAAAKRYLMQRGIAASRIETTSFGEERPLCTEDDDEDCWSRNRRDEFEITAGSLTGTKSGS